MEHTSMETNNAMPTDLSFELLERITHGFSEDQKVGRGGFGEVYKGVLDNGSNIAIKKLHPWLGLDDVQFKKEFYNLMRLQHKNIIRLVGYCYEMRHKHALINEEYVLARMTERALCFEYLQRGSLDKHLSDESCGLDWNTRYKIIKGICDGLDYLHNGSKDPIYHLDLKPSNILLDDNGMPKIADFGLSRLFESTKTHTTKNIIGTTGYMPPEYIEKRKISKKFDIFSLGIIIIEIILGPLGYSKTAEMSPQEIIKHVQERWKKRLQATSTYMASLEADSLELKTCIEIAIWCVESDRAKRPTIREVIDKLNEIETMRISITGQTSESKPEHLVIDPLELRFPFELGGDVSTVLQLTNRSANYVVFIIQANQYKYRTVPDRGILQPWSKQYIIVTLQAQGGEPASTQCNDLFLVQSARVISNEGSMVLNDVAVDLEKMMDKVVDEARLPIVYVTQPPPPVASPSC